MNIFGGLLFLQGHVASAELARQLASPSPPPPPSSTPGSAGRWPATSPTVHPTTAGQRPARP
ncbi:hypothetical protein U0039_20900 [Stenotrophomonas maltophilia]|uniref:hypothetical protein n=2 Tax=Stenotrophomonas maltophilia TaxID=40324 RepID=UPI00046AB73A|nr:hypothetical protein [Stenotrophomonas maltophilia]OMP39060.1 hypothetical protein BMR86_14805 [Stenotrophomonas sp. KAs 5-3]AIL09431.1 hypothetical protein DP16_4165 [Stenotrophomonas maltophilia]OOD15147.1 hypothetical protein BWP19_09690 [Stenotrophomonas maltophilia]QQA85277.1 hypothetical protein I6I01_19495 [Stenotrophomonas maltophilia]WQE23347.1 hypothetical protein U0039_20900 [Stenotrophomonas maltophilia]